MRFYKVHGLGNDFILFDARTRRLDWHRLAPRLCDRHFGIGADGLLLLENGEKAPFRMRIINADGSEAEMCGNGIRCFAKYLADHSYIPADQDELEVETLAGIQRLRLLRRGGVVEAVRVAMGRPRFDPAEIPVDLPGPGPIIDYPLTVDGQRLTLTFVSMGNPHAVAFIDEPVESFPLDRVGPKVEHHPLFPKRTNFEVVNRLAPDRYRVRVWERGVGLTLACGTGACAVAAAARLKGLAPERVRVELPGGSLEIEWDGQGEVFMTGPAAEVFVGEWFED